MTRSALVLAAIAFLAPAAHAQQGIFRLVPAGGGVAARPASVQECQAGSSCVVEVRVVHVANFARRCLVLIPDGEILVIKGGNGTTTDIVWKVVNETDDKVRFDENLGIDVFSDNDHSNREFDDGVRGSDSNFSTFKIKHNKRALHEKKAFNYNVIVQKKDAQNRWSTCGFIDPIIVNRPA